MKLSKNSLKLNLNLVNERKNCQKIFINFHPLISLIHIFAPCIFFGSHIHHLHTNTFLHSFILYRVKSPSSRSSKILFHFHTKNFLFHNAWHNLSSLVVEARKISEFIRMFTIESRMNVVCV